MFRLLACFLYVLPASSMDSVPSNLAILPYSDTFIPISDSESLEEACPLLNKEIPQETQILANRILVPIDQSSVHIPETDLLTPFSNRHPSGLLKDIFWFIISLCEKKDILNLCETSTHFRNQLRKLIPILTPLPPRPSSVQILNFLEEIEYWEESHKQLSKSTHNIRDVLNIFPRYWEELDRLSLAQTYVRFSPHFWWHNGSKRIQQIRDYYGIDAPKGDYSKLPLHIISSILRDPYGIHLCCTGLALMTGVAGWYIYMNNQNYADEVESINATYRQALNEKLKYAQSDDYFNNLQPWHMYHYNFPDPKHCFNPTKQHICINRTQFCQSSDRVTELEKLGISLNHFQKFPSALSYDQVSDFIKEAMDIFCHNEHHYVRRYERTFLAAEFYDYPISRFCYPHARDCNPYAEDCNTPKTNIHLYIAKDSFSPLCIAKHLTPPLQLPPSPVTTDILWSLGIGGSYLTFIVFLILGWCMGV